VGLKKGYQRILLKLSGEMLGGTIKLGIDKTAVELMAQEIREIHDNGIEIAVVIGGGNFFRGSLASDFGLERSAADHMGMLATCINALALQATLEKQHNLDTRVMTAIHMPELAEPYIKRKASKHLSLGRVVIFAAGTGNPLFTTDTAAALRAREMNCDIILKATKVDGIYDSDPLKNPTAVKFSHLDYLEVISKKLQVMDATAITMCMESSMPILVFKLAEQGAVLAALKDKHAGTVVGQDIR